MSTVLINQFDGGHAQDIRTFATNECEESLNFDLYTNPHELIPIRDSVDETSSPSISDVEMSDVGVSTVGGNTYLTAVGRASSVLASPTFYTRASGDMNGAWSLQATGTGAYAKGTMVIYKGKAFAMSTNGAVQRYDSAGTVTTVGTCSGTNTSASFPRPFVHPEDNVLYISWGNVISKWDGTTFTNYTTILPDGMQTTSLTSYGGYLAIAMRPVNGVGNSTVYLWGRDGTINTLQGNIDFGTGMLNILENVGGSLVGIVEPTFFSTSVINYQVDVRVYSGGSVTTVKSITSGVANFNFIKTKYNDMLYFAFGFAETTLWCVYKNKSDRWVITKERYMYNGSTTVGDSVNATTGLSIIGDYFYMGFYLTTGGFKLRATSSSNTYLNTSKYKTTINPNMPIADRYKEKQLEAFRVSYTGANTGSVVLKYSVDGSTMTTAISKTNTAGEHTIEATSQEDGSPFDIKQGREFQFQVESTGGAKIKEIAYRYSTKDTTI